MTKRKIVIGNWKMNPLTEKEAEKMFAGMQKSIAGIKKTEIVICPPFLYLSALKKISKKVMLGAQDAFWKDTGAFTGEVSAAMVSQMKAKYVVLGHSERRAMGEDDISINKKIKAVIAAGMIPVVCVGETERDHNHEYFNVVKRQVADCLAGIPKNLISKIIIAYEPVWAISTTANRRDATAADSLEMVIFIRKMLSDMTSPKTAADMRIIYGGSVTDKDAGEFLTHGGAEGLLVGRASLDAKKFGAIARVAESIS